MADTKSSGPTPPSGNSSPGLGQRLMGFLRPGAQGAGGQRKPQSATSRFITGSITFVLVAELLTYGLQYLDIQFKLHLQQPIAGPQVGWFTWFFLINIVLIIGLWILLQRMGFFPKDMWGARNGTTAARGGGSGGSANGKSGGASGGSSSANQIPGIGKTRTRAERRYTATVEAAKTTTVKKSRFGRTPAATTTTTTSAKAPVATVPSTEHDGAYDRVRAAQRQRKRRAAR